MYTLSVFNTFTSRYMETEVSKEVYDEYRRGEWRINKNNDKHSSNETPFSALIGGKNGNYENFHEFVSDNDNPERIMTANIQTEKLLEAIASLNKEEQALIHAVFFEDKNDYEYAVQIGVTHQGVNKRKKNILKKIRKFLEDEGC